MQCTNQAAVDNKDGILFLAAIEWRYSLPPAFCGFAALCGLQSHCLEVTTLTPPLRSAIAASIQALATTARLHQHLAPMFVNMPWYQRSNAGAETLKRQSKMVCKCLQRVAELVVVEGAVLPPSL